MRLASLLSEALFSKAWLHLREPADAASRNASVLRACASAFSGAESLTVCDIGSGTGASVRAFSGLLPRFQSWLLIDHHAENLRHAIAALCDWAEEAETDEGGVNLHHQGRDIRVATRVQDLAQGAIDYPPETGLVTASALFDLTSAAWIEAFVAGLKERNLALLATLTFNGEIGSEPPQKADLAIAQAFAIHQRRDKGFGPAAGPAAASILESALRAAGYAVAAGESPWRLGRENRELLMQTLEGMVDAVLETGALSPEHVLDWKQTAQSTARRLLVGHVDLFAEPPAAFTRMNV